MRKRKGMDGGGRSAEYRLEGRRSVWFGIHVGELLSCIATQ